MSEIFIPTVLSPARYTQAPQIHMPQAPNTTD